MGFPKAIKLIGRGLGGSALVTLKASESLPEGGEVLLHGVESLSPARTLPDAPPERTAAEKSWAFRGLVPRVTNEQATRMCQELKAGYAGEDFQAGLRRIQHERALGFGKANGSLALQASALAELAMTVQKDVLPRYGYEASAKGVMTMRHETRALFAMDPALMRVMKEINALLGLKDDARELEVGFLQAKRFDVDDVREWRKFLAEQGYVVLKGAVSPEETTEATGLLWDFIEESDEGENISRHNVKSWQDSDRKNFGWPAGRDDGISYIISEYTIYD